MYNEFEIISWNELKAKLKHKYPILTKADLTWRNSTNEDLLETIALKLGLTNRELKAVLTESEAV